MERPWLIWVEPPLIHQASYFWGMGKCWNGMVLCMLWSLLGNLHIQSVPAWVSYLVWIYVIKGQRGHFPVLLMHLGQGSSALENFHRSSEFCKVLPSSEQDEKWAMLNIWPFYFWVTQCKRNICSTARFKVKSFQLSQQMYTDTQLHIPLFAWMESGLS